MRQIFQICSGIILFLALSPCEMRAGSSKSLTISDNDWQPFFFAGKNPEAPGIGREILELCLPGGASPTFVYYPIKRMFLKIKDGSLDLLVMSYKKEREDFAVYGREKLFSAVYKPFVRKKSDITVKSLTDLDAHRIGGLRGLSYSPEYLKYLQKRFPLSFESEKSDDLKDRIKRQKDRHDEFWMVGQNETLIQGLVDRKIDLFVNTWLNVQFLAKKMVLSGKIKALDYVVKSGDYFAVIGKKSGWFEPDPEHKKKMAFLKELDQCLINIKKNERKKLKAIYQKYGSDLSSEDY